MHRFATAACLVLATAADAATFEIVDDAFGSGDEAVHLKVLRNTATGEYIEVVPELGGKTEALVLRTPRGDLRHMLLDHGRNATAARANEGWKGAMLAPYANRIANGTYSLNGVTHYLERNEDRGKYGKIGLHGYLYKKTMAVLAADAADDAAELTLGYAFDGTDAGYPFLLATNITYRLDARGFTVTTAARNDMPDGATPLPYFNSWHSYYKVRDISTATVTLDRCSGWNHLRVSNDSNVYSDLIPTGLTAPWTAFDGSAPMGGTTAVPAYYDDEFKATASAAACPELAVRVADGPDTAVLWMDAQFRFVQVFSGTKKVFGEEAIAVEAMSSAADAWNNEQGIRILQAGETFVGKFGVRVE